MMDHSDYFPGGYHSVNPYILVSCITKYFSFLETVFGAQLKKKIESPDESYLEAKIGDTVLMIQEQSGEIKSGRVSLWIYLKDVNRIFELAIKNGSTSLEPPSFKFETDIVAKIVDPFGVTWFLSSFKPSQ